MRGLGEAIVVGDPIQVVTQFECRGEMQGIEAPKKFRFELRGTLERRAHERHHRDRFQNERGRVPSPAARPAGWLAGARCAADRSRRSGPGAQPPTAAAPSIRAPRPPASPRQKCPCKRPLPAFVGAELVDQARKLRSAGRPPGWGPRSDSLRRAGRARPASMRSRSEPSPIGTNRATGRPRSVIVTVSPAATSATTAEAFCFSSRIPAVFMCYVVAHEGWPASRTMQRALAQMPVTARMSGAVHALARHGTPSWASQSRKVAA